MGRGGVIRHSVRSLTTMSVLCIRDTSHIVRLLAALHTEGTQLGRIIGEPFSDQESAPTSYNFTGMCRVAGAHLFHAVLS